MFLLLDTSVCQPLPSLGITRFPRYYELIRLPVTSSSNLVSSALSTFLLGFFFFFFPISTEGNGSPRFLQQPFSSMPGTSTPMEYPLSRLYSDSFVAAFRVVNHVGLLHDITIFGAQHLHPCGLRPTVSLSTLHPFRCLMSARLGSDGRLTLSGWLFFFFIQLVITSLAWRTNNLVF